MKNRYYLLLCLHVALVGLTQAAATTGNKTDKHATNSTKPSVDGVLTPNMSDYYYTNNGSDWKYLIPGEGEINYCATDIDNQSPINLLKPLGSYGFAYGEWLPMALDNIKSSYQNIFKDIKLAWIHNTQKVKIHETEQASNAFESQLAESLFGAKGTRFEALQLHFHHPSEHTIDGKHADLEIHIVHKMIMNKTIDEEGNPIDPGKIQYGVVGLLFSVENYDKTINSNTNQTVQEFLHELRLKDLYDADEDHVETEKLNLGEMMNVVNFKRRWVYHGSLTTPPCSPVVYWNVIDFIFPIRDIEFEHVKEVMHKYHHHIGGSTSHRVIQPIRKHGIRYLNSAFEASIGVALTASSLLIYFL